MSKPQQTQFEEIENIEVDRGPKLALQDVSLTLGNRVVLDSVCINVHEGEIVGVLGPNGSGKTSLMRCLTGLIQPDRGGVWLDGSVVSLHDRRLRACMGVVFQEPSLDLRLTVKENLVLGAQLFGLSSREIRRRTKELIHFMGLDEWLKEPCSHLSGGLRRRLELARALIHGPDILLLDEPTQGLDVFAFGNTWQRLLALRQFDEMSMLVFTHREDEAEKCQRLVVMDRGHIVACDTPEALLGRVSGDVITVQADSVSELIEPIEGTFDVSVRHINDTLELEVAEAHLLIPRLVESFPVGRLSSVAVRSPTLADAFYNLTGRGLIEAQGGTV